MRHLTLRNVLGGAAFAAAIIAFFWVGSIAGDVAGLNPPARPAQTAQR